MRFTTYEMPTIIGVDDWLIYGRTSGGIIVQTCAEMWPEWLDFATAPEKMENDVYRAAVIGILAHKRPMWRGVLDDIPSEDHDWIMSDILEMEADQAEVLQSLRK